MSFLSIGLSDVTILGVFSTALPGTFVIPRTVNATAIFFKEPDSILTSRQSHYTNSNHRACKKTTIPLGKIKRRFQPILDKISKITRPISKIKSRVYQKIGIAGTGVFVSAPTPAAAADESRCEYVPATEAAEPAACPKSAENYKI